MNFKEMINKAKEVGEEARKNSNINIDLKNVDVKGLAKKAGQVAKKAVQEAKRIPEYADESITVAIGLSKMVVERIKEASTEVSKAVKEGYDE